MMKLIVLSILRKCQKLEFIANAFTLIVLLLSFEISANSPKDTLQLTSLIAQKISSGDFSNEESRNENSPNYNAQDHGVQGKSTKIANGDGPENTGYGYGSNNDYTFFNNGGSAGTSGSGTFYKSDALAKNSDFPKSNLDNSSNNLDKTSVSVFPKDFSGDSKSSYLSSNSKNQNETQSYEKTSDNDTSNSQNKSKLDFSLSDFSKTASIPPSPKTNFEENTGLKLKDVDQQTQVASNNIFDFGNIFKSEKNFPSYESSVKKVEYSANNSSIPSLREMVEASNLNSIPSNSQAPQTIASNSSPAVSTPPPSNQMPPANSPPTTTAATTAQATPSAAPTPPKPTPAANVNHENANSTSNTSTSPKTETAKTDSNKPTSPITPPPKPNELKLSFNFEQFSKDLGDISNLNATTCGKDEIQKSFNYLQGDAFNSQITFKGNLALKCLYDTAIRDKFVNYSKLLYEKSCPQDIMKNIHSYQDINVSLLTANITKQYTENTLKRCYNTVKFMEYISSLKKEENLGSEETQKTNDFNDAIESH